MSLMGSIGGMLLEVYKNDQRVPKFNEIENISGTKISKCLVVKNKQILYHNQPKNVKYIDSGYACQTGC